MRRWRRGRRQKNFEWTRAESILRSSFPAQLRPLLEVECFMFSADVAATPFFLKMEADSVPNPVDGSAIDFALMARIGEGDHQAFRELVERHQNAVIGTLAKMLGNVSEE